MTPTDRGPAQPQEFDDAHPMTEFDSPKPLPLPTERRPEVRAKCKPPLLSANLPSATLDVPAQAATGGGDVSATVRPCGYKDWRIQAATGGGDASATYAQPDRPPATSGKGGTASASSDLWGPWNANRLDVMASVPEAAALQLPVDRQPGKGGPAQPQALQLPVDRHPGSSDDPVQPFTTAGLQQLPAPALFIDLQGHLVNERGERVDHLGRLTRPRGAKGKTSSKRWPGAH
jgi:hypothetical protein